MTLGAFTSAAARRWSEIDGRVRFRLLNNVWCAKCAKGTSIVNYSGRIEDGDLILEGACAKCGHSVARVVES
jgi:hypothetical protein